VELTGKTYTTAGRYDTLTSKRAGNTVSRTFQYGYLANSALVNSLTITGGHAFSVSRGYDAQRNLLTSIDTLWGASSQTRFDYTHTVLGQRQTAKLSGNAYSDYWTGQSYSAVYSVYGYSDRGELQTAAMYRGNTPSATPSPADELPGRRFEYRFNPVGNRTSSGAAGDSGDDAYADNAANQYTSKENKTFWFAGTAATGATVAVDGISSVSRKDRAWAGSFSPANTSAAVKGSATAYAALVGGGSGGADLIRTEAKDWFVPKRTQTFAYDYAGNLTSDSVWDYTYDAENRLLTMQHRSEVIGAGMLGYADVRKLEFTYDYLGRRVQKIVRGGWNGSWFTAILSIRKYLYDGWNVIAEFDATGTLTLVRSYTWGLDVTGSPGAAGGVGALLQFYDHAASKTYLASYDGNGNVAALFNADSGAFAAVYEYGPAGEPLRAEVIDSAVADQPFRFSTKFTDRETGLVYYGQRYYSATLGRFINRDPIGEAGGINLYGFCANDGVNGWDYLGMDMYLVQIGSTDAGTIWADGGDFIFPRSDNGQVLLDLPGKLLNGMPVAYGMTWGLMNGWRTGQLAPDPVYHEKPEGNTSEKDFVELAKKYGGNPNLGEAMAYKDYYGGTTEDWLGLNRDRMAALFSDFVYRDKTGGLLGKFGIPYEDNKNGFGAGLYRAPNGEYYLAMRGTQPTSGANWLANLMQGFGFKSSQYDQAVNLANAVDRAIGAIGGNLIMVGHSLGGGLASAGSYATGRDAITFNAAGLSSRYATGNPGNIRAHYIRGDILSMLQDYTPFFAPSAAGTRIPHAPPHWHEDPLSRHLMGNFLFLNYES
jgi:RHS repeat-associated protein